MKPHGCRAVVAGRSVLACRAGAINNLLTIAALASDRVGVAGVAFDAVAAESLDAHARLDRFRAVDGSFELLS